MGAQAAKLDGVEPSSARALRKDPRIFAVAWNLLLACGLCVSPDLMLWCLKFFPSANIVLDPFMGSGTTLVAAKMMGLQAIGIERSEGYCALAVDRIKRAERIVEHA